MLRKEDVAEVLQRPEVLGRLVGFTDLTALHGEWGMESGWVVWEV